MASSYNALNCITLGCSNKAHEGDYKCAECLRAEFIDKSNRTKCLKCGNSFISSDKAYNRICDRCKNGDDWRHGNDTNYTVHNF